MFRCYVRPAVRYDRFALWMTSQQRLEGMHPSITPAESYMHAKASARVLYRSSE